MDLNLSAKEFRLLLDLAYIGNWIINSPRGNDRITEYDFLQEKLFSQCPSQNMNALITNILGSYFPSQDYVEGGIHEVIADYEDSVFFSILAEELARRDLDFVDSDPEDFTDLAARMDEYLAEFEKNGLDTINIDI